MQSEGDIEKSLRKLLESYHRDFSENVISETRAFVTEFKTEIVEKHTVHDLLQLLYVQVEFFLSRISKTLDFVSNHPGYCGKCGAVVF